MWVRVSMLQEHFTLKLRVVLSGRKWDYVGQVVHYMANTLINTRLSEYKQHLGSKRYSLYGNMYENKNRKH